jgi:putative toxin-antitoxin system antitoxin component (TIGR02293 family)
MYQMITALAKQQAKKSSGAMDVHRKGGQWGVKKTGGGVVNYCVHGPAGKIMASDFTPSKLIEVVRLGLPVQELKDLQASLDVPMEKLVPMLGISKATLHRRKAGGRLGPAESDRVVRFARLMGKAVEVLQSEENARQWLTLPQFGLGGAVPLEYAETEVGAREVEDLLGRIEYGVYS